jgi:hypothetical protein
MALMNYLVFVDAREKILSGVKTMLVKKFDPAQTKAYPIHPGDSLYFLRNQDDCAVRVKATVVRVLFVTNADDLSHTLKGTQPRLQLTEDQYNHWSAEQQVLLVEFGSAQKIGVVHVAPEKTADRPGWVAFEDFSLITDEARNKGEKSLTAKKRILT